MEGDRDARNDGSELRLRSRHWIAVQAGFGVLVLAAFVYLLHQVGRHRAGEDIFVGILVAAGLAAILVGLMTVELRTDHDGLHWRHFGLRRSLPWSAVEGFGVWRSRSADDWNALPIVRFTRSERPRPPACLMIRLTPAARAARGKPWLYERSGYDIGLNLPFRMSLAMLTDRLEQRLALAREA